jgi:hypothetical protein
MKQTLDVLNTIDIHHKKAYASKRNALYKELLGMKEPSVSKMEEIKQALKKEHDDVNSAMAKLREVKPQTYSSFDYIENHISRSKRDLLQIITFLNKAHEQLIILLAEIQRYNRQEINFLDDHNFNKALKTAVLEKKILYEIISLGENIGHDIEEGISYNTGWYSETLANEEKLLRPLHLEYETHKEHSKQGYKGETYKHLLKDLRQRLGYKHSTPLTEEAEILMAEKLYEHILYFINLSKTLTKITNQCALSLQELKDVNHKGFRGWISEFFG